MQVQVQMIMITYLLQRSIGLIEYLIEWYSYLVSLSFSFTYLHLHSYTFTLMNIYLKNIELFSAVGSFEGLAMIFIIFVYNLNEIFFL